MRKQPTKKKENRVRQGPKIDQEFVLKSLLEFMMSNQSLILLDIASTGLNDQSIKSLAQNLKDHADLEDE